MEDFVRAQRLHVRSRFVWGLRIALAAVVVVMGIELAAGESWIGAAVFATTILLLVAAVPWLNRRA